MRVYTNSTMRNLISYGKLFLGLIILFVLFSQAIRIWQTDPALQEIRNLTNPTQTTP